MHLPACRRLARYLLCLSATAAYEVQVAQGSSAAWTPTSGATYDWNDNANWSAPFPNGSGQIATIQNSTTGSQILNLNQAITVGGILLGNSSNPTTIEPNGGNLIFAGGTTTDGINYSTNPTGTITDTISANMELQSSKRFLASSNTSHKLVVSGVISGAGGLALGNANQISLTNLNTFTGNIIFQSGTISISSLPNSGIASNIGAGTTLGASNGGFAATAQLTYTGAAMSTDRAIALTGTLTSGTFNFTVDSSGTGPMNFTNTATMASGAAFTAVKNFALSGANTGDNIFSGLINKQSAGTVRFTKSGDGVWTLANTANSYNGSTTLSASTPGTSVLKVAKLADGLVDSSIGSSSNAAANLLIGNGSTLQYTGSGDSTDRSFTVNGTSNGHTATLDASGTGPILFTNTASPAYGTTNQTRTLILKGSNTHDNTLAASLANNGTSAVSVTKSGNGRWLLSGNSVYTGATSVTAGTLVVSDTGAINSTSAVSISSGAVFDYKGSTALNRTVNVANGATFRYNSSNVFSGTLNLTNGGTIGGGGNLSATSFTLASGSKLSPGNSPGALSTGSQTWANGGSYLWEINALASSAPAGSEGNNPGWDFTSINGTLTITAGAGQFNLNLDSLGALDNWNQGGTYQWRIASANGGISGFNSSVFNIDATAFLENATLGGTFSVSNVGNDIFLNYVGTIPEPSSGALLAAAIGVIAFCRSRRKLTNCP